MHPHKLLALVTHIVGLSDTYISNMLIIILILSSLLLYSTRKCLLSYIFIWAIFHPLIIFKHYMYSTGHYLNVLLWETQITWENYKSLLPYKIKPLHIFASKLELTHYIEHVGSCIHVQFLAQEDHQDWDLWAMSKLKATPWRLLMQGSIAPSKYPSICSHCYWHSDGRP